MSKYCNTNSIDFNPLIPFLLIILGIVFWTLEEYAIHKGLFHCESRIPDYRIIRFCHFVMHGYHHLIPADKSKLVFPVFPAVVVYLVTGIAELPRFLMGGGYAGEFMVIGNIIGYMAYDLTHYFVHHMVNIYLYKKKLTSSYYQFLKTSHNNHHYIDEAKGFSISNHFWDIVFKT